MRRHELSSSEWRKFFLDVAHSLRVDRALLADLDTQPCLDALRTTLTQPNNEKSLGSGIVLTWRRRQWKVLILLVAYVRVSGVE
jgi:hypothetical protein